MLSTLRNVDLQTAQYVLAQTALTLLPDPGVERQSQDNDRHMADTEHRRALSERVLAEARQRLKVGPDDDSVTSQIRLYEYLGQQITDLTLTRAATEGARSRLGQRGDLRPDQYRINFPPQFNYLASGRGIRPSHVEEALRTPDDVQHFLPFHIPGGQNQAISIYLKQQVQRDPRDNFVLLVESERHGDIQHVQTAWRIYQADVDISSAHEPIDVLRLFVDVYGIFARVGAQGKEAKFVLYEVFPSTPSSEGIDLFTWQRTPENQIESQFQFRRMEPGLIEVAVAYAIDMAKYLPDLERHHVQVDRRPWQPGQGNAIQKIKLQA